MEGSKEAQVSLTYTKEQEEIDKKIIALYDDPSDPVERFKQDLLLIEKILSLDEKIGPV